jgi:hypothetical protein
MANHDASPQKQCSSKLEPGNWNWSQCMNSPTIDHTSNRNSTKHPARTCLYGNWNILITFTRHQKVQLRQRTWMTYRFCFFTSSCALCDFIQKSLRNFASSPPSKRIWKAAGLIRKFGINPIKIRSIFNVVQQSFSFAELLLLFFFFPGGSIKTQRQLSGKLSFHFDSATS